MSSITLESIKKEQTRIVEMIMAFEAKANEPRYMEMPATRVALKAGEEYAGIILGKDGTPNHHLILLPGEAESVDWAGAKKFAEESGGELPTRREQSLLFANLKEQFQGAWYWSCEAHASDSNYAWCQYFSTATSTSSPSTTKLRVRLVRRLTIE